MNNKRYQQNQIENQDYELMFSLINAGRIIEQQLEQALVAIDLSLAKFGALTHLIKAGEMLSLSECAEKMSCVRSNITQLMDRLESDGLVKRVLDSKDRRTIRAKITKIGIKRQALGAKEVAKVAAKLQQTLKGINHDMLQKMLSAIN